MFLLVAVFVYYRAERRAPTTPHHTTPSHPTPAHKPNPWLPQPAPDVWLGLSLLSSQLASHQTSMPKKWRRRRGRELEGGREGVGWWVGVCSAGVLTCSSGFLEAALPHWPVFPGQTASGIPARRSSRRSGSGLGAHCTVRCRGANPASVLVTITIPLILYLADENVPAKILSYNRANRAVAILCNHQRAPPKTFEKSMQNLQTKVSTGLAYVSIKDSLMQQNRIIYDY